MNLSRVLLVSFVLFLCVSVTYAEKADEEHEDEGHEKKGVEKGHVDDDDKPVKGGSPAKGHTKGGSSEKGTPAEEGGSPAKGHTKGGSGEKGTPAPVEGGSHGKGQTKGGAEKGTPAAPVEGGSPTKGGSGKKGAPAAPVEGGSPTKGGSGKKGAPAAPVEGGSPAKGGAAGGKVPPVVEVPPVDVKGGSTVDVKQFGAKGDGSSLDTQAFLKAWQQVCSSSAKFPVLVIPSGNYVLNAVEFLGPCNAPAVGVQLVGNIISSPQKADWSKCTDFISFRNIKNLQLTGTGAIDGNGAKWWANQLSCGARPTNLALNSCTGVSVTGIQSKNSARNHISISATSGATISGITLTAPATSPNTDGIDISSSSSITIKNSVIGSGDDCIAINKNSKDINVNNVKCGPGHGISIGSLGRGGELAQVENVVVSQCTFDKTDNGARIKTWKGGRGYVRNVIYRDITLIDVRRPIIIDQNYVDKNHPLANEESSLSISDVHFINFKGTCQDSDAITLECSTSGAGCTGVELANINIQGATGAKPLAKCENANVRVMQSQPPVSCMQKAGTLDYDEYLALTQTDY